jgi:TolB-like protein/DNA-binding winged helix-turn-helix (wHTH) protein/Flp pilus assembly protein TadD
MSASEPRPIYEFADFRLDPWSRSLVRQSGERVAVKGKGLDALIYLIEHAGELVSRAALTKALWPTTVVEDNSLTQVVSELRRTLGPDQRVIETVSGRGYQFVCSVRVSPRDERPEPSAVRLPSDAAARVDGGPLVDARRMVRDRRRRLALVVAGVITAFVGLLAAARYAFDTLDAPAALPSSVAVLPFRNASPNPDDAYFAAGFHEEVLSRLAKIRALTVIGRTSVIAYADTRLPISKIAEDLRVEAVLEGSASREAGGVQVNVRLVAGPTGSVLWSEVYEGSPRDLYAIEADIVARVATALGAELQLAEIERSNETQTESLEAHALYLRAIAAYREAGGVAAMPDSTRATIQSYLDRAIDIDPDFAAAYAWKAYLFSDALLADGGTEADWASQADELSALVEEHAARALRLDSESSLAHVARARLALVHSRYAASRAALERAQASNPSDSRVLQQMALLHALLGEFPQAIDVARRAIEVDPKNPGSYAPLAAALQLTGHYAEAAAAAEAIIEAAPGASIGYVLLARAEAARGDLARARDALMLAERLPQQSEMNAIDLAVGYRRVGAVSDAERLVRGVSAVREDRQLNPALRAAAHLAQGDYDGALQEAKTALDSAELGMGPKLQLAAIEWNVWSLPVLEESPWRELRREMVDRK